MAEFLVNGKLHHAMIIERDRENFVLEVNGKTVPLKIGNLSWGKPITVEIHNKPLRARMERLPKGTLQIEIHGRIYEVKKRVKVKEEPDVTKRPVDPVVKRIDTSPSLDKNAVVAPIAGKIVLLKATVGQRVTRGQCILVLEAMKMENEITAPTGGVVSEIRVAEGSTVNKSDILAVIS